MPSADLFPSLRPDELDFDQQAFYQALTGGRRAGATSVVPLTDDEGRLAGPFAPLLYAPLVGDAVQRLGERIRYDLNLSDREREMVTLFVAGRCDSAYEVFAHRRLAPVAGVSEAEVAELAEGRQPAGIGDRERAALALARELCDGRPAPEAVAAAVEAMGRQAVVEVTLVVGYYRMLAGLLDTCT